tara:strand:- start:2652 stop:2813 length:162 start_codon:yes stop_codon:yes gene_type:complete
MTNLPPHLAKFFKADGSMTDAAAARVEQGRIERQAKADAVAFRARFLAKARTL